ncbi:MAG TPA: type I restriction enzyme endonuclease domain-containing protein [Burkholderiaceae bacterium]
MAACAVVETLSVGLIQWEREWRSSKLDSLEKPDSLLSIELKMCLRHPSVALGELTEMVKKMPKLDWTERESVRASLRRNVRRLLAKYGYPPDLAEGATQLVLRQAELSTENSE